MRNIKLTIAYDGTNYAGWQVQKVKSKVPARSGSAFGGKSQKLKTVQETIEKALEKILQEKVKLTASGRTDSGVHAIGQVANFKTDSRLFPDNIQKALNSSLPKDIVVKKVEDVALEFHARYSATSKSYRYTILNSRFRSPFDRHYAAFISYHLDASLMQDAAVHLVGRHDFRSFQAKAGRSNSTRTIKSLGVKRRGRFIYIDIEADGFLYNMVRNIVGTLIEVGRGKLGANDVMKILKAKKRSLAGPTALPEGLCLVRVRYTQNKNFLK